VARVLQIVTELVVGGASLTMLDFAEDLASEHELHIVHGRLEGPVNAAAIRAQEQFPTYELPRLARRLSARDDAAALHDFNTLCRRIQPDIIHSRSSKAGFVGRIGAPPHGARALFHTIHGWGHTPLDGRVRRGALVTAERICALRTTKLIAVSPEVREEGLALRIGRPSQYTLIGDPVEMRPHDSDFDAARAAARAQLNLPADGEVIGWVGRFSAQKDPRTLAELLARLLSERHDAYAVLVGDGPDRALMESRLASEIAERRVLLTGVRDDVAALYPAFDVVVHTSLWEGHPRVVREALAALVPVVTARVNGTGVIGTDPRLGTRVEPGDTQAFVAALARILDSPTLRAPIDDTALAPLRAAAREPYRLMRELYRAALGNAGREHPQRPARVP
jgi:glycosyltransferase involved in cell wall biosynthesis